MKGNSVGPAAIAGAVIVVAIIVFAIYHFTLAPKPTLPSVKPTSSGYGPRSAMSLHTVPGNGGE